MDSSEYFKYYLNSDEWIDMNENGLQYLYGKKIIWKADCDDNKPHFWGNGTCGGVELINHIGVRDNGRLFINSRNEDGEDLSLAKIENGYVCYKGVKVQYKIILPI